MLVWATNRGESSFRLLPICLLSGNHPISIAFRLPLFGELTLCQLIPIFGLPIVPHRLLGDSTVLPLLLVPVQIGGVPLVLEALMPTLRQSGNKDVQRLFEYQVHLVAVLRNWMPNPVPLLVEW